MTSQRADLQVCVLCVPTTHKHDDTQLRCSHKYLCTHECRRVAEGNYAGMQSVINKLLRPPQMRPQQISDAGYDQILKALKINMRKKISICNNQKKGGGFKSDFFDERNWWLV